MGICMEKDLVAALAGGFHNVLEQGGRNKPVPVLSVYEPSIHVYPSVE